jgi:DNA invertase Pin-like site-specific DNA recombinase
VTADLRHYITAEHLQRLAIKYVRQSTIRQVRENTESAYRQYGLQGDLEAFGWAKNNILTIDDDQAHSGASTAGRDGFQRLMSEVAMGRVGIVAALEMPRLSRDNADWAQLVKVCALSGTLLMDEHGVYDPRDRNDRMTLGIKGHLSENERLMIRDRYWGAILSRAKRGLFRAQLPVGFVYEGKKPEGERKVLLDPDQRVQQVLRHLFETFRRVGSGLGTARAFRQEGLQIPARVLSGPQKGEIRWKDPTHDRVLRILHNPRYAGAYFYGRGVVRQKLNGRYFRVEKPRDQWISLVVNAHPGYITWEEFERNVELLGSNHPHRPPRGVGAAREGPALLQGLVLCGVCGRRMTVNYLQRIRGMAPVYVCDGETLEVGGSACQRVNGEGIDAAMGALLVEMVTPSAMAAALEVHQELKARQEEASRLRRQTVENARYERDLAHRRYLHVDPENRLVAASLEKAWNEKLQAFARAEAEYAAAEEQARSQLRHGQHEALREIPTDFGALWRDPRTPYREKKRMARLILEDVTLSSSPDLPNMTLGVRFKGGACRTLTVPRPLNQKERTTSPEVVRQIQELARQFSDTQIAKVLNERGVLSATRRAYTWAAVKWVRESHGIPGRYAGIRPRPRPRGKNGAFLPDSFPTVTTGGEGVV